MQLKHNRQVIKQNRLEEMKITKYTLTNIINKEEYIKNLWILRKSEYTSNYVQEREM